jgi:hypothetical protein
MPKAKTNSVDVKPITTNSTLAGEATQRAVAAQIAADRASRSTSAHVVIGPEGKRYLIEDLHLDVRFPGEEVSKMLGDAQAFIKPEFLEKFPDWVYTWAKRESSETANNTRSGVYERVPFNEVLPLPNSPIARSTFPDGSDGATWKSLMLFRMSPQAYADQYLVWEKMSWQRQIRQTKSPMQMAGVEVDAKITDRRMETVSVPKHVADS